jgi:hypothetical protein
LLTAFWHRRMRFEAGHHSAHTASLLAPLRVR